eukprot:m.280692 g.280692  ORF g.280692 m.280692 type:complete len:59 (+) comp69022_c0_seq1:116-292(+)
MTQAKERFLKSCGRIAGKDAHHAARTQVSLCIVQYDRLSTVTAITMSACSAQVMTTST